MRIKLLFVIIFAIILLILASGYGLFQVSRSRTFQFFGGLTHRVNTNEKIIALTFDDAPTTYSDEVVEILHEKDVKATFYVIGQNIEKYPDEVKNIVTHGHELGNHSYSHQSFLLRPLSFVESEIQRTNELIRSTGPAGEITETLDRRIDFQRDFEKNKIISVKRGQENNKVVRAFDTDTGLLVWERVVYEYDDFIATEDCGEAIEGKKMGKEVYISANVQSHENNVRSPEDEEYLTTYSQFFTMSDRCSHTFNTNLQVIDKRTGNIIWSMDRQNDYFDFLAGDAKNVYLFDFDDTRPSVYAHNVSTGDEVWRYSPITRGYYLDFIELEDEQLLFKLREEGAMSGFIFLNAQTGDVEKEILPSVN